MRGFGKQTVVVPNTTQDSAAIDLHDVVLGAIVVPAIDNATFALRGSNDGGATWLPMISPDGTETVFPASVGGFIVDKSYLDQFGGFPLVRIHLGAVQTADRTFTYWTGRERY